MEQDTKELESELRVSPGLIIAVSAFSRALSEVEVARLYGQG